LIKANWFRELKSEEELDVGISEAHPPVVLYEIVGPGRQRDSRCGVMVTAIV